MSGNIATILATTIFLSVPVTRHLLEKANRGGTQESVSVIKLSPPIYPPVALQAAIVGDVQLSLLIRPDGTVESATVESGHPLLKQAALDSAQRSQFICESCGKEAVSFQLFYSFRLGPTAYCTKDESYPRVTQSHGHITVVGQAIGTCDPAVERQRVASAVAGENLMGMLVLPDGSKFQTTLYDMKVIGQLRTLHKSPYYVLSGVGCQECDANVSVYIHSPSDGPMKDEGTQRRFAYPGQLTSNEDGSVVSETRMFLGSCLSGHADTVVWFEHWKADDKKWHDSVFLAEIKDDNLVFQEAKTNTPKLSEAETSTRKSGCRELPGKKQWEEP